MEWSFKCLVFFGFDLDGNIVVLLFLDLNSNYSTCQPNNPRWRDINPDTSNNFEIENLCTILKIFYLLYIKGVFEAKTYFWKNSSNTFHYNLLKVFFIKCLLNWSAKLLSVLKPKFNIGFSINFKLLLMKELIVQTIWKVFLFFPIYFIDNMMSVVLSWRKLSIAKSVMALVRSIQL